MAKSFGQYTGGIQAIQGINEFGAQQAAGIERTMGGLANTITNTYKTLNEQEEENSANKELIKGQSGNLAAIKKLMDANPDTKDNTLSQGIGEMIAKLDTAGGLNRGQLKGLLKSSEIFTSQLPLTMQLQDKAFLAQTTAGVQAAMKALKNRTVTDDHGYEIPVPSFQGGSPEKYQKDLRTFFEQHKKDNPNVQLDVDSKVRDSIQQQIQFFTNDPDLKKADPTYQQHLIRGFESLAKRDKLGNELSSQSSEDYGTGENIMEQVGAIAAEDRLSTTAPADIRRGEIEAQKALEEQKNAPIAGVVTPESLLVEKAKSAVNWDTQVKDNSVQAELDLLKLKRQHLLNGATPDELTSSSLGGKNFSWLGNLLTGGKTGTKAIQERTAELAKGWTPSNKNVNEYSVVGTVGKGRSIGDVSNEEYNKLNSAQKELLSNESTRAVKSVNSVASDAASILELRGNAGLPDALKKFDAAIKAKETEIENRKPKKITTVATSADGVTTTTTTPAPAPATTEAQKPDMYASGFDYKMTIPGVYRDSRPLTYEEEKDGIRQWFEENHNGVVPSTIDAIYKSIRPEAGLIIHTLPTGEKLMHTDKGWTQLTQMAAGKQMTSEERSDEGLFNFGQIVGGRRIPAEAVKDSGIMVNGFFSGGKKRAEMFAQNLQDVAALNEAVPLLVEQFKKFGHSFKLWNQTEQGLATSYLAKIRAAIRVETVGTGPVALAEHEMISKRLGDPNALFTLDASEISKLNSILSSAKSNLQRQGVGLNVTFRPPTKAGANPIQQNKVANRVNQPQN